MRDRPPPRAPAIVVVAAADHDAISTLRREEYLRSRDFTVPDLATLDVGATEEGTILAARTADGAFAATMAGVLFGGSEPLGRRLGNPSPTMVDAWPTLFLQRAATSAAVREAGLNSLLRYHFFRLAVAWGIRYVVGGVVLHAARTRAMAEMGYQFFEEPNRWRAFGWEAHRPTATAVLDLSVERERAFHVLALRVAPLIAAYPFADPQPPRPAIVTAS